MASESSSASDGSATPAGTIGRRIAQLRAERGWTQQQLADRAAMSRVAVSHLEAGMSQPSERSVALLAGLFRREAHELVAATDYPQAKSDRLPLVVARYTEVELQLRLLGNDLAWCAEAPEPVRDRVRRIWGQRLSALLASALDGSERDLIRGHIRSLFEETAP